MIGMKIEVSGCIALKPIIAEVNGGFSFLRFNDQTEKSFLYMQGKSFHMIFAHSDKTRES